MVEPKGEDEPMPEAKKQQRPPEDPAAAEQLTVAENTNSRF